MLHVEQTDSGLLSEHKDAIYSSHTQTANQTPHETGGKLHLVVARAVDL